jgi:hypothetical protein
LPLQKTSIVGMSERGICSVLSSRRSGGSFVATRHHR